MSAPADEQLDIDFDRSTAAPPPASSDEVSAVVAYLSGRGWVRAREIILDAPAGLALPAGMEAAKRKLRTVAEAGATQILSYPGSRGYRALRDATRDEVIRGIRAHRSQARVHIRRAVALIRFRHGMDNSLNSSPTK